MLVDLKQLMMVSNSALLMASVWLIIILLDKRCKNSRYFVQYNELLQRWGIMITTFHIQYKTTIFNRIFTRTARLSPRILSVWFNFGIVLGILAMLSTVPLLIYFIFKSYHEPNSKKILQPVMPGVNLPWNQLSYYVSTLLVTGAFHEMGHAVAATRENVKVNSFGVFLFLLYPGAFVELNTVQLEIVSPLKRLRIYTAGVWHNFVLAIFSLGILSVLQFTLLPFYLLNTGVVVTWINPKFTIASQLHYGSVVKSINRCPVFSVRNWYSCLQKVQTGPVDGYCNSMTYVRTLNSSLPALTYNFNEPDCCNDTSTYRFCYVYNRQRTYRIQRQVNMTELSVANYPKEKDSVDDNYLHMKVHEHACLPARLTMSSRPPCLHNRDCGLNSLCLKPLTSKDIRIIRIAHSQGQDILFVGKPQELFSNLMVSDYVPKHNLISPNMPGQVSLLLKYLFSISAALAVLNMVPCTYLDGHQVLCMLLCILFPNSTSLRPKVEFVIVALSSFLLGLVLLLAFYSLFIDGLKIK